MAGLPAPSVEAPRWCCAHPVEAHADCGCDLCACNAAEDPALGIHEAGLVEYIELGDDYGDLWAGKVLRDGWEYCDECEGFHPEPVTVYD